MGPGGALDRGPPGSGQQPMESLASGLGLAPGRPGLLWGLYHDAGHLRPGAPLGSCQLLGLKEAALQGVPLGPAERHHSTGESPTPAEDPAGRGAAQSLFARRVSSKAGLSI